jgi:hypothetical protein
MDVNVVFGHVRYARWNRSEQSMYFSNGQIYPIMRVEGDSLVVIDNSEEEQYIDPEDLGFFEPITDTEYKSSKKHMPSIGYSQQAPVYANRPVIEVASKEIQIQVELNENQFPYWAQYIIINNEGVWATTNNPDEVSTMKEKVTLDGPIIIKLPKEQKPFEILAQLFKDGKITYEELESEIKTVFR